MAMQTKQVHCGSCYGTGSNQTTHSYTDSDGMLKSRDLSSICYSCGGSGRQMRQVYVPDVPATQPARNRRRKQSTKAGARQSSPVLPIGSPERRAKYAASFAKLGGVMSAGLSGFLAFQAAAPPVVIVIIAGVCGLSVLGLLRGPLNFLPRIAAVLDDWAAQLFGWLFKFGTIALGAGLVLYVAYKIATSH